MQNKINLTGWEPGFLKISFMKALQDHKGMTLGESKEILDSLLRGGKFEIEVDDLEKAKELVELLRSIGAVCEIKNS